MARATQAIDDGDLLASGTAAATGAMSVASPLLTVHLFCAPTRFKLEVSGLTEAAAATALIDALNAFAEASRIPNVKKPGVHHIRGCTAITLLAAGESKQKFFQIVFKKAVTTEQKFALIKAMISQLVAATGIAATAAVLEGSKPLTPEMLEGAEERDYFSLGEFSITTEALCKFIEDNLPLLADNVVAMNGKAHRCKISVGQTIGHARERVGLFALSASVSASSERPSALPPSAPPPSQTFPSSRY